MHFAVSRVIFAVARSSHQITFGDNEYRLSSAHRISPLCVGLFATFIWILFQNSAYGLTIPTSNQSPLVSLFGLPPPHHFEAQTNRAFARMSLSNNFIPRENSNEFLLLDGETLRVETGISHSISDCWVTDITVPFLQHSGGGLDSFVDDWHAIFNLPESGRPLAPTDRLLYQYERNGVSVVNIQGSRSGIGDVRLSVAQRAACNPLTGVVRAGVKLATGDPDDLFGSGGNDVFVDFSKQSGRSSEGVSVAGTAGVLVMGSSELFSNQRSSSFYGSVSLDWVLNPVVTLESQLSLHSPFFNSSLKVLDDWAIIVSLGGTIRLSDKFRLELSMSEDPVYGASPDVVFHLGLVSRY